LATLKRQEKRRYGSISRGGVFFASWENPACDQSQASQAANLRDGAPLAPPGHTRRAIFHLCLEHVPKKLSFFRF